MYDHSCLACCGRKVEEVGGGGGVEDEGRGRRGRERRGVKDEFCVCTEWVSGCDSPFHLIRPETEKDDH